MSKTIDMNKALMLILTTLFSVSMAMAQSAGQPEPPMPGAAQKASTIKIIGEATGMSMGVKVKSAIVTTDTSIKVAPQFAYLSIEMSEISGASLPEVMAGTPLFWVKDRTGKMVKIPAKFLKKIKGSSENNLVDFVAKIPFKLKTDKAPYIVRFRWLGPDKKKMIDFAVALK